MQLALASPTLDAVVIYYGSLVTDPDKLRAIHGPVLGIFGNQDVVVTPQSVREFEAGLKAARIGNEIHRYDGVHAFANPSNPKYDEKAAADAWLHVRRFFQAHLKV